jgi:tripartite-type tricarboxylate transporter receptor subunit TctC
VRPSGALLTLGLPTWAQTSYPARPIVLVVPQAAGGTNDIVGRIVAQKLGEKLSVGTVVENRPGAGGNIGTQAVAKAARDGHTLLMTISSSQAINPALYKSPGFDPVGDFTPVSMIGAVPNVLLAHPSFPARTVPELLALARSQPRLIHSVEERHTAVGHRVHHFARLRPVAGVANDPATNLGTLHVRRGDPLAVAWLKSARKVLGP